MAEVIDYASLTAYGEAGPEGDKTGFDTTAYWARSGLMDEVRADHEASPARSVPGMGDHPTASALFGGIAAALYRRERTGQGGEVRANLMNAGMWANTFLIQVKTELCYKPMIAWSDDQKAALGLMSAFAKIEMKESYSLRPRMSTTIPCTTGC